jgi:predicted HicB family RNase H-like nuclease
MKYKGYTGIVELDEESQVLSGRVIGLRDVITFEGDSVGEVMQAFRDSVDDYLAFCAERGESPEKPYSGQFVLRLDPVLHRELANAAEEQTTSLNAFIEGILSRNLQLSDASTGRGGGKTAKRVVRRPVRPASRRGKKS